MKLAQHPAVFAPLPTLRASTVIFDIDETITYQTKETAGVELTDILIRMAERSLHLPEAEIGGYVRKNFDPDKPLDDFLRPLGVSEEEFCHELVKAMKHRVGGYADALNCIQTLAERGFRLLTGTTNSRILGRTKLQITGLLTPRSIAPFASLLGGSEVYSKGKSEPEFFIRLLRMHGLTPEEVVHVGDLPEVDLAYALGAGISQVVLPRRNQTEDWVMEADGGLYVRSLEMLPQFLEKI